MKQTLRTIAVGLRLAAISFLLSPSTAFAQSGDDSFGTGLCLIVLVFLAINIAILVWIVKDAQARGTSAGAWLVIVLLFGVLGLLAYLVARPKGKLVPCPECGKQKPIIDPICPHCGKRVV